MSESTDAKVSEELLERVVEFHGHLGPFLVLGLKAGLLANSMLGKDYFKTTAIVFTERALFMTCAVTYILDRTLI